MPGWQGRQVRSGVRLNFIMGPPHNNLKINTTNQQARLRRVASIYLLQCCENPSRARPKE